MTYRDVAKALDQLLLRAWDKIGAVAQEMGDRLLKSGARSREDLDYAMRTIASHGQLVAGAALFFVDGSV